MSIYRLAKLASLPYLLFLICLHAKAHEVNQLYFELVKVGPHWEIQATFDADYALPESREDLQSPQPKRDWLIGRSENEHARIRQEAEKYLRDKLQFNFGGEEQTYTLSFPDYQTKPYDFPKLLNGGAYINIVIRGNLPEEAHGSFSAELKDSAVPNYLFAHKEDGEMSYVMVEPGSSGDLFTLSSDGIAETDTGLLSVLWLGYRHVIPDGLDHILFILGLFLMARKWRLLLWQSLAFTIAHSVTLGLVVADILPIYEWRISNFIEPLIALSIAAVAIENFFIKEAEGKNVYLRRVSVVFAFGLIHGLGFAGSLGTAMNLEGNWLLTLAIANTGVELAQVTVLIIAWTITIRWWRSNAYEVARKVVSAAIACVGIWWTIERIISSF